MTCTRTGKRPISQPELLRQEWRRNLASAGRWKASMSVTCTQIWLLARVVQMALNGRKETERRKTMGYCLLVARDSLIWVRHKFTWPISANHSAALPNDVIGPRCACAGWASVQARSPKCSPDSPPLLLQAQSFPTTPTSVANPSQWQTHHIV